MSSLKRKSSKSIAILLAVVMILGIIPVSLFTAFALPDVEYFTVTVTDSVTGDPITEAKVRLETPDTGWTITAEPVFTDENGKANFDSTIIADALTEAGIEGPALLRVIVEKSGYDSYSEEEEITADNLTVGRNVSLAETEKVTLTGTVTNENGIAYEGAVVKMTGSIEAETTTDKDGNYSFKAYKGLGEYIITATAAEEKYLTATTTVSAPAENYTCETLKFEIKQFNVNTTAGENGTITGSDTVAYGSTKEITATADKFYRIKTFVLDGVAIPEAVGCETYTHPIENITSDKTVNVTFERYSYKITFTVGENGEVKYNDGSEQTVAGGSVSIEKEVAIENGKIKVVATPSDNHRVSKVVVDGVTHNFTENGKDYSEEFIIEKDHTFEVEFAINKFTVEIKNGANGEYTTNLEIVDNKAEVDYGSGAEITIRPAPDNNIETVTVNDTETTDYTINSDETSYTLKVGNITENTTVEITYSPVVSVSFGDSVSLNNEGVLKTVDGEKAVSYIYAKNGEAAFTANGYEGIRVNDEITGSSFETKTWKTTISTLIEKIEVYKDKKWWNVTLDKKIQIVIDKEAPFVKTNPKDTEWTNADSVTISGSFTDKSAEENPSSGLSYIVWSKDKVLANEEVLKATDNKIALGEEGFYALGEEGFYSISVDEEQNSTYYIYAVDVSGNVSAAAEVKVQIDRTPPTIKEFIFSTEEKTVVQDSISFLTFGTICSETMYVTVVANDDNITSGLNEITLSCGKKQLETKRVTDNCAIFELNEEDFRYGAEVSAVVTDVATNSSVPTKPTNVTNPTNTGALSDIVFVDGTTNPIAEIVPDAAIYTAVDGKLWYNGNLALAVTAKDENTGIRKVSIKLNGQTIETDFNGKTVGIIDDDTINDHFSASHTKEEVFVINTSQNARDGENTLEVVVTNNAGIESVQAVQKIYIDKTKPDISKFEITHTGNTPLEKAFNFLTFGMFFDDKVEVTVTASDSNASSGVNTITLYVDDAESEAVEYETYETKEVIDNKAKFVIPAEAITDNTMHFDKVISAKAVDYVGNETENFIEPNTSNSDDIIQNSRLMIETIKPTISVSCADPAQNKNEATADTNDWYNEDIEFTVNVADADSGIRNVNISINDKNLENDDLYSSKDDTGEPHKVETKEYKVKTSAPDVVRHDDGSYTIKVVVTDNAGNVSEYSKTVYKDIDKPYITGFDFDAVDYIEGSETESTVEVTDYGFYFKTDTKVTVSANDNIPSAGVKSITYYTVDKDTGKSAETTLNVNKDGKIEFTIEANFKGQIYAKATDNTDNVADRFVNPNGTIVEDEGKHKDETHIIFTKDDTECTANDNTELYANDVPVKLTVIDTYSGIRSIEWSVKAPYDAVNDQSGRIVVNNDKSFTEDSDEGWNKVEEENNLVTKMEKDIVVKNNSNNIIVTVKMVDRAGNTSEEKIEFGIDKTIPTIEVVYDNNEPDEEYKDIYKADREATITITERNFRAEDIVLAITNTDEVIPAVDLTKADVWTTTANNEEPDKTVHVAKIKYTADGDYTFDISYKDNADNAAETFAQHRFTIDKTIPVVSVNYNNNSANNGNYYKADRTATITITEHNFDAKRVKIFEATPVISDWNSEGDVHTATIAYIADGKYTLDIEFLDMAGNSIENFAAQEFYIDKTNPTVAISGIVDQSANNDDGNIGFSVTATDVNFDGFAPVLSAVVMEDGSFESKILTIGNTEVIPNGKKYTVTNIDTDGIYSITCTVVDKAGNAYSEVVLEDADGKTYVEKRSGSDKLVTFSVNRNGSVFALDSYTDELVDSYYVKNVTKHVTIIEINADPILENTVTLNGKKLVENTDYTVTLDNKPGSWYKYSYSLNQSLFDGESEYNIVVSSKDKATNEAFSDVKDVAVEFVVDRTAPIVTVAGLKTNGRYQVDKQVVTLVPADDGGSLKSLIVRTVDENGKLIKELINLSGDELSEAIANGNITFELGEGLYQNVQIICEDYAGNISGSETDEIYSNVSISSSAFMIFWANKPLRWGSISGILLLIAAIVLLIVFKKRKKAK